MNKIHHTILSLLDTRNSHWPHEVHPYGTRYQSLVAAMKDSPIQKQPQKQKQPRAARAKLCAALTQGKAFTGKIWKKGSFAYSCIFGRWMFQPGLFGQDGAVGCAPLFVGSALQNKFTTVPETELHPLTLHFRVQNRRKTCWGNSRAAQIFCNPSPDMSPLRA